MKKYNIYLSGPSYHNEEFESMKFLNEFLKNADFKVFSSYENGFQTQIIKIFSEENIDEFLTENYKKLCLIAFSMEYSEIIDSDACINFLNGRVPDESTIIKMGIAFSMGIPVINYKYDSRILFPNGVNTMIQGLTNDFSQVKKIDKLPKTIKKKIKKIEKIDKKGKSQSSKSSRLNRLSPYNRILFNFGTEVGKFIDENFENNLLQFTSEDLIEIIKKFENHPMLSELIPINGKINSKNPIQGKVYCSGALFCPAEVRDMKHISDIIEKHGLSAYLPQRDGGEPYVMGSIDNPLAGAPIAVPVTKFLNKVLYSLDIYEILKCEYFIVNLNGRAYDDGAMAELGVAFGAGKPIILFKNDIRTFYKDRIHPTFNAISYSYPTVSNFEKIPSAIEKVSNFINKFGENKYFSMKPPNVTKFYNYGLKWFKRLEKRTPPISQMEIWNKKELNN